MALDSLKSVSAMVGAVGVIVSTAFVVDNRYVHASEHEQVVEELNELKSTAMGVLEEYTKQQRIQTLTDLVFDIQIKGELGPVDKARLDRYTRELDYLQGR